MATSSTDGGEPWFLKYGFSVRFPHHPALTMGDAEFAEFLKKDIGSRERAAETKPTVSPSQANDREPTETEDPRSESDNLMATQNMDKAYVSTTNPLVDLFTELEEVVSGPRLGDLLDAAWAHDPLATLKIIFNARSIHLGKASRVGFYKSAGWLLKHHPLTLISNLQWLSRPIIEKKAEDKGDNKRTFDDMVLVDVADALDQSSDPAAAYDVANGVAHGYWKDLLNLLALAANDKLDVLASPKDVLNITREKDVGSRDAKTAETMRHEVRAQRQSSATRKFETDPVYRGLHLTVARLFAAQLKKDLTALQGPDAAAKRRISLCGKWAPSHERFHDRHTYIVSSIAELLHPMPNLEALLGDDASLTGDVNKKREVYLRHVREGYRKSVSALRKHLDVVERHLSAKTYSKIKYDRVPSTAMNTHLPTFIKKDPVGFEKYADDVAEGKARISGATLLPSTLIRAMRCQPPKMNARSTIERKVLDGQWNTLVQRIKDSGTLESSIAVCDVSGSMSFPVFPDKSTPMDSSIGLSMLIAEVSKPPFGGSFITFSERPEICELDISQTLSEKYRTMEKSTWGACTSLTSAFEDIILPRAIEHDVKPEDMAKRVFVFSDMHFDQAEQIAEPWSSSYERIAAKYEEAGYAMPELIYWNLAGGDGDEVAPKPVTADTPGTAMVSGYSQGMLKVFLEDGSFENPEEEVVDEEVEGEDGEMVRVSKEKKQVDPVGLVMKAISHGAYSMLEVAD